MKYHLLILLCSIGLQAQTYEGTLGNYPVVLDLDMDYDDNRAIATYFYKSKLKNIDLEGHHNASELTLFKKFTDPKEEKELFTLSIKKDNISGTWKNNGQTLKVDLNKTITQIDDYKLSKLKYVRDSVATYGTKALVWFTETHSKHALFRFGNGFKSSELEFMNSKLEEIHANYALMQLNCNGVELKLEIEHLSNQYFSFTEYSSVYCGGAHPSHNTLGYNFDYKNGIQFDEITAMYPKLNLFQALKEKYGNDTDLEPECEYFTDHWVWKYASWVLTNTGVTFTPSFPHAMTPCEMGFSLTYEELEQNNKN